MLELEAINVWLGEHSSWLLPAIAIIAFIESFAIAGIIVPGVAILFSAAAVASISGIPLLHVLAAAFVGAVAGDVLSFFIGRWFKDHLKGSWIFQKYPKALAHGEDFFNKYGTISVVIGRFVGPLRPVLPLTAGMLGMPALKFVFINVCSAVAWAPFYIMPGYIGGELTRLDTLQNDIGNLVWLSILIAGALLPWFMLYRALKSRGTTNVWVGATALALFCALCIFLKLGVLERLDVWAFAHAISWKNAFLDYALVFITLLGDEWLLISLFTLTIIQLLIAKRPDWAISLATTGILTNILTRSLKSNFDLARPDYIAGQISSAAFPSGHTSGAWVLLGLLGSIWLRESHRFHKRVITLLLILATAVAGSRILLGVHWISDIAGGILLAAMLVSFAQWLQDRLARRMGIHTLDRRFWRRLVVTLSAATLIYQGVFFGRILPLYQSLL